jgi:uncharacterized protein
MIIDCHTHIFPPSIIENRADFIRRNAGFAALYDNSRARMITAEELIESMDAAGIDISVALNFGWRNLEDCIMTNDYIMESVARFPKRLIGFGSVLGPGEDSSIAEIERCAKGGLRGIGEIRPDIKLNFECEQAMAGFRDIMLKNRLTLLTHSSEPVGHKYPGKDLITPAVLESLIERLPGVNIICAHWGGGLPFYDLMPEVKKSLTDVYFDSAASPFLYSPQVYKIVASLVGPEKVLFGSDYPVMSQKRLLDQINKLDMGVVEKEMLLYGNAAKLFGLHTGKI